MTLYQLYTFFLKLRIFLRYKTIMAEHPQGGLERMITVNSTDAMGNDMQLFFDGELWYFTDHEGMPAGGCSNRDITVAAMHFHFFPLQQGHTYSEKSDNKALPFKDREPKLMRGAPMTNDEDCCRPWVSPDDPHIHDPQTYTTQDLLELGIVSSWGSEPQPLRLCGFCKTKLQPIEYCIWMTKDDGDLTIYPNDPENLKARLITTRLTNFLTMEVSSYAWLHCDECHAANWVGGDNQLAVDYERRNNS